jgi:hypothetical protein
MKRVSGVLLAALCALFSATPTCASTLYGSSFGGEGPSLWSIDQNTGGATALYSGTGMTDLASDWRPGSFRIWGIFGDRALLRIDPATGNQPLIGFTAPPINALAFNVANGILYGVAGSSLYRIDPTTAATTLVGNTGYGSYTCMGADLGGNLFGVTMVDNNLVRINATTGVGQAIGPAGTAGISDLAVRPEDGVMFGVRNFLAGSTTPFSYHLLKIDTATAATTLVGDEQLNKTMSGLAFSPAVPEPSVLILAAMAAIVYSGRLRCG